MAEDLSGLLGDAVVALFDWAWPRFSSHLGKFAERVAEAVLPDPPMSIRTIEGEIVTGLLVVDRGTVLIFVGTRAGRVITPPPNPPYRTDPFDGEPLWGGVSPFRR